MSTNIYEILVAYFITFPLLQYFSFTQTLTPVCNILHILPSESDSLLTVHIRRVQLFSWLWCYLCLVRMHVPVWRDDQWKSYFTLCSMQALHPSRPSEFTWGLPVGTMAVKSGRIGSHQKGKFVLYKNALWKLQTAHMSIDS